MKILMNCIEAGFAIVALLLVCLFCTYAWPESAYGLAAWVQAIGSIIAIFSAIAIAAEARKGEIDRLNHDRQFIAEEKRNETLVVLQTIVVLIQEAQWIFSLSRANEVDGLEDPVYFALMEREGLGVIHDALRGIPLHQLKKPGYVECVAGLITATRPRVRNRTYESLGKFFEVQEGRFKKFILAVERGAHKDVA